MLVNSTPPISCPCSTVRYGTFRVPGVGTTVVRQYFPGARVPSQGEIPSATRRKIGVQMIGSFLQTNRFSHGFNCLPRNGFQILGRTTGGGPFCNFVVS